MDIDLILEDLKSDIEADPKKNISVYANLVITAIRKNDKERFQRFLGLLNTSLAKQKSKLPADVWRQWQEITDDFLGNYNKSAPGITFEPNEVGPVPKPGEKPKVESGDQVKAELVKDLTTLVKSLGVSEDVHKNDLEDDDGSFETYRRMTRQAYKSEKIQKARAEGKEIVNAKTISHDERAGRNAIYKIKTFTDNPPMEGVTSLSSYVKKLASSGVKPEGQIKIIWRGAGNNYYKNPVVLINGTLYQGSTANFNASAKPAQAVCVKPKDPEKYQDYTGYFTADYNNPDYEGLRKYLKTGEEQIKEDYFPY